MRAVAVSSVHAGPHPVASGECSWRHHFEDVTLYCRDQTLPGLPLCADHFIAWAHARADAGLPAGSEPTRRTP